MRLPLLVLHIAGGIVGVLSGFTAVAMRKGSRWHQLVGQVFVVSMLTMSSCGTYLAVRKHQTSNVFGGILTFYMVATAWSTARRQDGKTSLLDWGAFAFVAAVTLGMISGGFAAVSSPSGLKDGMPAGPYFVFGSIAALAGLGDLRMLVRGGLSGTKRLARHLWRMCFALFVASASIFLARQHLFPEFMRKTGMLWVLSFLPLGLMLFWLVWIRVARRYKRRSVVASPSRLAAQGT